MSTPDVSIGEPPEVDVPFEDYEAALLPGRLALLADERTRRIVSNRSSARLTAGRGWLMRRSLLTADIAGLLLSFLVAEWATGGRSEGLLANSETLGFVLSLPVWVVVARLYGLYDRDEEQTDHSTPDDIVGVFHLVTVGSWVVFMTSWLTGLARPEMAKIVLFWLMAIVAVSVARAAARSICRHRIGYWQNTVIVGAGDVGQSLARKVLQHPEYGLNVVGFVDDDPRDRRPDLAHLRLLGGLDDLADVIEELRVERVLIAFSNDSSKAILDLIRKLNNLRVQIDIVPRFFDVVGPGLSMHTIEGLPLIGLPPVRLARSSRLLKRTLDVVASAAALVFLAIPFLVIGLLIKLDSAGPVFFRQVRMGSDGTFRIWKFRTMLADADQRKSEYAHLNDHARNGRDPRMFKITNDPRVTRAGRWIRRYSLDELPQLINVLRGEMSLVGPRPLILDEDKYIAAWGRRRLDLKPGITGLWQVTGRHEIPFEEMVTLDYRYVMVWSLWTDIRLILRTIPILARANSG